MKRHKRLSKKQKTVALIMPSPFIMSKLDNILEDMSEENYHDSTPSQIS